MLSGNILYKCVHVYPQFDATSSDVPSLPGFVKYPPLDQKIQCCIIFLDASTFEAMPSEVTQNIKDMQLVMNSLGQYI